MRIAQLLPMLLLSATLPPVAAQSPTPEIAPCRAFTSETAFVDAVRCTPIPAPPIDTTPAGGAYAHSYNKWAPTRPGECTAEQHNAYRVQVEGKWYPTWHPPAHPSGCLFGHEHGKDPAGSALSAVVGPVPFGLANEALLAEGGLIRHEDHAGHKVEWLNAAVFKGSAYERTCDVLVKIHQGSSSPDAFTNNLHEMAYHLRCSDGAGVSLTELVNIGPWGQFKETCTSEVVLTGTAPPDGLPSGFGGSRFIPTRKCVDAQITGQRSYARYAVLSENWAIDPTLYLASGKRIAFLATYSFVNNPSRYYDPTRINGLARTIDLCWEVDDPKDGRNMDACKLARGLGVRDWDHPDSPFTGAARSLRFNQIVITNAGGPEVVYTDAFGKRGQTTPFPGSIRQYVSAKDNQGVKVTGPSAAGNYAAPGVHPPN